MLCTVFDVQKLNKQLKELENQELSPDVYSNVEKAKIIGREKRKIDDLLQKINQVKDKLQYFIELTDGFTQEELENIDGINQEISALQQNIEDLYISTLYNGKWDSCDCVLEIHSGAGGEEAQDWAEMLYRMYVRYCDKMQYEVKVIDSLAGTGAGYKSISLLISGANAYGNLINEKGVHRLVRISPFDANKRRHTSFASVDVSPIIENEETVQIKQEEIKIDTYRAGGAGGQHVNKTESAVRITHLPTGIVVQCQNERSQLQNKEFALKMLASKLEQMRQEELEKQKAEQKSLDKKIEWGSQIRSYVLHPYNMVKDHRTNEQTSNTTAVLDGDLSQFIIANLINRNN